MADRKRPGWTRPTPHFSDEYLGARRKAGPSAVPGADQTIRQMERDREVGDWLWERKDEVVLEGVDADTMLMPMVPPAVQSRGDEFEAKHPKLAKTLGILIAVLICAILVLAFTGVGWLFLKLISFAGSI